MLVAGNDEIQEKKSKFDSINDIKFSDASGIVLSDMMLARHGATGGAYKSKWNIISKIASYFEEKETEEEIVKLQNDLHQRAEDNFNNLRKDCARNQTNAQKNTMFKFLSPTYLFFPKVVRANEIVKQARTGDLIFLKSMQNFSFGSVDASVVRGVSLCTTKEKFISSQIETQYWSQIGIVIELFFDDGSVKGARDIKYVVGTDGPSIRLYELAVVVAGSIEKQMPVALRRLKCKDAVYRSINRNLQQFGVVLMQFFKGKWVLNAKRKEESVSKSQKSANDEEDAIISRSLRAYRETLLIRVDKTVSQESSRPGSERPNILPANLPSLDEAAIAASLNIDNEALVNLFTVVIYRVKVTMLTHSIEDLAEAKRAFFLMDNNGDGVLSKEEIFQVFSGFIHRSGVAQENKKDYIEQTKAYINRVDKNKDGMISLVEFIDGFKKLSPVLVPNENLNLDSVLSAEFAACLLASVGILRKQCINKYVSYRPMSFATCADKKESSFNCRFGAAVAPQRYREVVKGITKQMCCDCYYGKEIIAYE